MPSWVTCRSHSAIPARSVASVSTVMATHLRYLLCYQRIEPGAVTTGEALKVGHLLDGKVACDRLSSVACAAGDPGPREFPWPTLERRTLRAGGFASGARL